MKVLYLNNYDTSFIQNQIIDLKKIGNIEAHFNIHLSYWNLLRYHKGKINNVISNTQQESLSNSEKSVTLHWGLPKNYLVEHEPWFVAQRLMRKFKKGNFDLIHAQNGFPSGYVAMLLAMKWDIPYMITSHGMDTYKCLPNSYELGQAYPFSAKVVSYYKKALVNADCVAGVSEDFADFMTSIFPEVKIIATPNSYNYNLFRRVDSQSFRQELNIKEDDFIVLSTGYFIERKAHKDIIKAISQVNISKLKLVLIGGGPLEDQLKNLADELGIRDKLVLINNIPQKSLVKWYNIADVFVFPSLYEPFGLGLVEAMACGVPSIATNTWGPNEIIEENENGFLVHKSSPEEIADKIQYLFDNPIKRKEMQVNAAHSVLKKYAMRNHDLLNIYQGIITNYEKK